MGHFTGAQADAVISGPTSGQSSRTYGLVADQVVQDGRAAVVLLDPVHFEGVALGLDPSIQLGRVGVSWPGTRSSHMFIFAALAAFTVRTFQVSQKPSIRSVSLRLMPPPPASKSGKRVVLCQTEVFASAFRVAVEMDGTWIVCYCEEHKGVSIAPVFVRPLLIRSVHSSPAFNCAWMGFVASCPPCHDASAACKVESEETDGSCIKSSLSLSLCVINFYSRHFYVLQGGAFRILVQSVGFIAVKVHLV